MTERYFTSRLRKHGAKEQRIQRLRNGSYPLLRVCRATWRNQFCCAAKKACVLVLLTTVSLTGLGVQAPQVEPEKLYYGIEINGKYGVTPTHFTFSLDTLCYSGYSGDNGCRFAPRCSRKNRPEGEGTMRNVKYVGVTP